MSTFSDIFTGQITWIRVYIWRVLFDYFLHILKIFFSCHFHLNFLRLSECVFFYVSIQNIWFTANIKMMCCSDFILRIFTVFAFILNSFPNWSNLNLHKLFIFSFSGNEKSTSHWKMNEKQEANCSQSWLLRFFFKWYTRGQNALTQFRLKKVKKQKKKMNTILHLY